jgi:hypothetical protein
VGGHVMYRTPVEIEAATGTDLAACHLGCTHRRRIS